MKIKKINTKTRLANAIVSPVVSIENAIKIMDNAGLGVLLICGDDQFLIGILTDGDVRRALMKRISFKNPCEQIAEKNPLTAVEGITPVEALNIMDHGRRFLINRLPILDKKNRVVDLWLRSDLIAGENNIDLQAVVMAGGFGKRLKPLTDDLPKPMLPMGDKPMMEHIIDQLREASVKDIRVTTHFMPEKIKDHFGNGENFGVKIDYVPEEKPLGTAGAIGLMPKPDTTSLVINGDIMTGVDFRAMLEYHRMHNADITVGVRKFEIQVPYGVLKTDESKITGIDEKPVLDFFVNAGIYLLEPSVHKLIPKNERFDMTDLIESVISQEGSVISFPILEYWFDIGRLEDYQTAQDKLLNGRLKK